jgi:radical SAM superfamily enzyme YgiQ (UPF0313 family)
MPPLGLLYLASSLRARFGSQVDVRVVDLHVVRRRFDQLGPLLEEFRPHVVGISALNWEAEESGRIAHLIKTEYPDTIVALGGPFAHRNTGKIAATGVYDWIFDGEADLAFPLAIERWFEGDGTLDDIVGLTWRDEGDFHNNGPLLASGVKPPAGVVDNLDALPFPAWDLVDFDGYAKEHNMNSALKGRRYAPLFTSRGCPFLCTYCHDIFGKKFRWRSTENVLEEARLLRERYGVDELEIVDDIFNMNSPRMRAICRGLEPLKFHICFPNGLRCDILDEEDVDALARAGTYMACVAVETVTPRLQELIKKRLRVDATLRAINWMAQRGIVMRGFFMLGFPTETLDEIQATIDFAVNSKLTQAYFFHVVPQPGTPLYDLAYEVNAEALRRQILQEYNGARTWYGETYGVNVNKIQRRAYLRFYLTRPDRWYRLLSTLKLKDFVRDVYDFFRMIHKVAERQEEPLPEALQPLTQLFIPDETAITSAALLHSHPQPAVVSLSAMQSG